MDLRSFPFSEHFNCSSVLTVPCFSQLFARIRISEWQQGYMNVVVKPNMNNKLLSGMNRHNTVMAIPVRCYVKMMIKDIKTFIAFI